MIKFILLLSIIFFLPSLVFADYSSQNVAEQVLTEPTFGFAQQNIITSQKEYEYVDGFIEIVIRDPNGDLVGYIKTSHLEVHSSELAQTIVNSWPMVKTIDRDGQNFDVYKKTIVLHIDEYDVFGGSGGRVVSNVDNKQQFMVYAFHDQYIVDKGDKVSIIISLFKTVN